MSFATPARDGSRGDPVFASARSRTDDEQLVARVSEGDSRAVVHIWKRYAPLVKGLLRRRFGPSPDCPDLEQEVFLSVFEALPGLRRPAALEAFIFGICVRVGHNYRRRRKVRSIVGVIPDVSRIPAPAADEETRDVVRRLAHLLDKLGPRDRSLFVSRYVERMGIDEIASSHRMTFATTRRRIVRMTKLVSKRARNDAVLAPHFERFALLARRRRPSR
jgi:RNA polymerase sigma-70 factor (ECF subfamily)